MWLILFLNWETWSSERLNSLPVLVAESCLTLCNPMDCSPPGFSVHGILQARILEWITIPFSRGSSQPRDQTWVSCTAGRLFTIQGNNLGIYHQGSPKNTGAGRHSLLWRIFLIQGSNLGLLHCRQIVAPSELVWGRMNSLLVRSIPSLGDPGASPEPHLVLGLRGPPCAEIRESYCLPVCPPLSRHHSFLPPSSPPELTLLSF